MEKLGEGVIVTINVFGLEIMVLGFYSMWSYLYIVVDGMFWVAVGFYFLGNVDIIWVVLRKICNGDLVLKRLF